MSLQASDWHQRYVQQAGWTTSLRSFILGQISIQRSLCVLEVGCGTGAVLADLAVPPGSSYFGIDINLEYLFLAKTNASQASFMAGNAYALPFSFSRFDLTYCHFLLLWLKNPGPALAEMLRVTRPGGWVVAFAEPDYGGRVDYPEELVEPGRLQTQSLVRQGANPYIGRSLAALWSKVGLVNTRVGVLGAAWSLPVAFNEQEWQVMADDLAEEVPHSTLQRYRAAEQSAAANGERILYVPTFYAMGQVPVS